MTKVRELDPKDIRGRRKFTYEPYIVGLARDALGTEPLGSSPNPFVAKDIPEPIKNALAKFSYNKVKRAIMSTGYPEKKAEKDKDYAETLSKWNAGRDADVAWVREHKDSPHVKAAIARVKGSESYRKAKEMLDEPKYNPDTETWAEHLAEHKRWRQKQKNLVGFRL